jgi:hypothetical protein
MLKNKLPQKPAPVINTDMFKLYEYIVLVPTSNNPNKVSISGTMFHSKEAFLNNSPVGGMFFGEIEFNINDAGLLDACQNYALNMLGSDFEACPVPVKMEE